MSKFEFTLKTVEKVKNIALDTAKLNYSRALEAVTSQEEVLLMENKELARISTEMEKKNMEGITILEFQEYKKYIRIVQHKITEEEEKLKSLKKVEARRYKELVEAKQEKKSLEKLKEEKQNQFLKEEMKKQEKRIDEFVSNKVSSR